MTKFFLAAFAALALTAGALAPAANAGDLFPAPAGYTQGGNN